ncbi:hypothetical protein [Pseudogemmobacter faecipullorum]|uniref:Uncharacterized protein n=1 Tax=Pseudogemmobacter faecipullorum TaxID=2755041 RepID=A0ABS8CJJ2_9RHOB|nr:hypothetical protein [Pseudogemmobacter faecipullorum]MCB5409335.1 hypothetical protein [Pseudogemmobacter faecipullorum]
MSRGKPASIIIAIRQMTAYVKGYGAGQGPFEPGDGNVTPRLAEPGPAPVF